MSLRHPPTVPRVVRDISLPLSGRMPTWPGDPAPKVVRLADVETGDPCTLSELHLGAHSGTHVDAPAHYLAGGATVDEIDLGTLIGPAFVAHLPDVEAITADVLDDLALPAAIERLLLRTRNSERWWRAGTACATDFVALTADGARWLVDRGVRLIGIDALSIAAADDIATPHTVLLAAGVVVLEAIDLSQIEPGAYDLVCLPLRISGAEGAPARAVLLDRAR